MILSYNGISPKLTDKACVIGNCTLAGDVTLSDFASVWPGASVRAELAPAVIGERSNIQDNVTVHTDIGFPVVIGEGVSVGHNAVLHGCEIGDNTLIGMGAVVLNGAKIGKNCVIAAGALVRQGMEIPDGSMVIGLPAVIKRQVTSAEIEGNMKNAQEYLHFAEGYKTDERSSEK